MIQTIKDEFKAKLEELGLPVLTLDEATDKLLGISERDRARLQGMLAMCRYLITYGCTPEKVLQAHREIEQKLKRDYNREASSAPS